MSIEEKLLEDMKRAMKSGDKISLETIRMVRAQLKNAQLAKGDKLTNDDVIDVLTRETKRRKESIVLYKQGGRDELVAQETKELEIIRNYLPEALSQKALREIVDRVITETEAKSLKDMGKVMGVVMSEVKGRAEGKVVQELVKKKLS